MKKFNSLLLIDDNFAINRLNQIIVEELELAEEVYLAKNGLDALELIKKGTVCPDLIIIDINMPVMNGLEFLSAYEQLNSGCQKSKITVSSESMFKNLNC